ncbi:MAG: hypothetical protein ABSB31_03610 [Dehalococcoidia bacterium]
MDAILNLVAKLLEKIVDDINSSASVFVSLNAHSVFQEEKDGGYKPIGGGAVILVINDGKEELKIGDAGLIFKGGGRVEGPFLLDDEHLPCTLGSKDHLYLHIKREALMKIGWKGIDAIKYVYIKDRTFQEYKGTVPRTNKMQIVASLAGRIRII